MATNTKPLPTAPQGEVHQRFRRLRRLIDDDAYRVRVFIAISLCFLVLFALLALAITTLPSIEYDLNSTLTIQRVRIPVFAYLMIAVSAFGFEPWAALIVIASALLVGRLLGWKDGIYLALFALGQGILNSVLKSLFNRPRPAANLVEVFMPADGTSFPSGHVMFYTVFFGFLFFLAAVRMPRSWLRTLTLVSTGALVALVGLSRMYVGAHWLTDVIGSYLIGLVILMAAIEGYARFLAPHTPAQAEGTVAEQERTD